MIPPIKFPKLHIVRNERAKVYRFTLIDDTVVRKKLKDYVPAIDEEKPRVIIFEDDTFTVGMTPIIYKRTGNKPDDEWVQVFQFKAVHIEWEDEDDQED